VVSDADVVIVGGRCAGATLALRLARAGLRVVVVDRARFPSETLSTHVMQSSGVAALRDLGVAEELFTLSPPIERAVMVLGDVRTEIRHVSSMLGAPMLNVRRVTLDAVLLKEAEAAGAEIHAATNVRDLLRDGGRVVGVKTDAGDLSAALVVGADGARSSMARLVDAKEYAVTPPGRLFVWGYFDGVAERADGAPPAVWLGKPREHGFLASHTDGGLFMAVVTTDLSRKAEVLADREGHLRRALGEWPELASLVAPARAVDGLRAVSSWRGFFRQSAGPGWALVGDAGHFKDPTAGQGISDALRQTERLTSAVVGGLHDRRSLDRSLLEWWRWRDDDAWAMYWFSGDLGAPGASPPFLRALQEALARDPRRTEQLARVLNHSLSPTALTAPSLVIPALLRALRRPPTNRREVVAELRSLIASEFVRRRLRSTARRLTADRGA
jgi:2-polyprenyl-6-methoxyphenol hydroxylase-like FAD-dependent oxidoreductase